jgi:hypothetical protein
VLIAAVASVTVGLPYSGAQIDKPGARIRDSERIEPEDLDRLQEVLAAHQRRGSLVDDVLEYSEDHAAEALAARFRREVQERGNDEIEVVVLGAADRDELEVTHSRYFGGVKELAEP